MAGYTPMMQQYLSIKSTLQDTLLLFRLGDFYELFFEDALIASQELEITLTGREAGQEKRVPMCGVPHHAADGYITRLIEKGYKVAICEQMEDPKATKGVVHREVVRIVTPGTVMDTKAVGELVNNFIVALSQEEEEIGAVACDLTTGELYVTSFPNVPENVFHFFNVYKPKEVVGIADLMEDIRKEESPHCFWVSTCIEEVAENKAYALLIKQFPDKTWEKESLSRRQAVAHLLSYLNMTQKRNLQHLRLIETYESFSYMTLDELTRRNLELTETVRERSRQGSLLALLDRTKTAMGARQLKRWLDQPLLDRSRIAQRLDLVETFYNDWMNRQQLRNELGGVYDLERLAGRIAYGTATPRDLLALKNSLRKLPKMQQICLSFRALVLSKFVKRFELCTDIADLIEEAISEDAPAGLKEGGMIRFGYHAELDELTSASRQGKQWIANLEQTERAETGIKSLKVGFNKVFGYFIEVTHANAALVPKNRYERKQTLANAERFVTKELKEKEALILEADAKMTELEYDIFLSVRKQIAYHITRLQELASSVAKLDVLQAFAEISAERHYVRPMWSDDPAKLTISAGTHPMIEALSGEQTFIANDTFLANEVARMLLITGPNMAGKSTYMRQVAIIVIMGQIGCFVPAKEACFPIVDRIFTRIGASDDLVGGQSTFMVEMKDIQIMTAQATSRSLIIIDELGRGTSTDEGRAIAQAVIEYVHDRIGCKALVSTHFHELATLEKSLKGLKNGCMAVKESKQEITFLHKLIPGAATSSYGVYCAKLAGLPMQIVNRAYELCEVKSGELQSETHNQVAATLQEDRSKTDMAQVSFLQELADLDVLQMTPLRALEWIHEKKNQFCTRDKIDDE